LFNRKLSIKKNVFVHTDEFRWYNFLHIHQPPQINFPTSSLFKIDCPETVKSSLVTYKEHPPGTIFRQLRTLLTPSESHNDMQS